MRFIRQCHNPERKILLDIELGPGEKTFVPCGEDLLGSILGRRVGSDVKGTVSRRHGEDRC